jgi:ABC-type multidrug transport system fused ATPase/permease subunit
MERISKSINNSVFLEFHNISYSLISPKNKIINDSEESVKTLEKSSDESNFILNDITGYALPKQVLAIIGPTGSGKSSLLSILADRLFCEDTKAYKIARNVKLFSKQG